MQGFVVAVPDAPSDHPDGLDNFRDTPEHAEDLGVLIEHMRKAYPGLPVWLVSTSRGTISATNALANAPTKPDHVVLTSSVTFTPSSASDQEDIESVPGWESSLKSGLPILMIDDSMDVCGASPPLTGKDGSGAQALAMALGDREPLRSDRRRPIAPVYGRSRWRMRWPRVSRVLWQRRPGRLPAHHSVHFSNSLTEAST